MTFGKTASGCAALRDALGIYTAKHLVWATRAARRLSLRAICSSIVVPCASEISAQPRVMR